MVDLLHRGTSAARTAMPDSASDGKDTLGRIGLVGRGVLYAVVGLLALQLAFGSPDEAASSEGALAWIGEQPFGQFLLVAMTLSLFALAAWRFLDAVVGDPVDGDEPKDRVKFAGSGVLYLSLAVASASLTVANWSGGSGSGAGGSEGGTERTLTATVLDWPMGPWLVGAIGLGVIGYAGYQFWHHAIEAAFTKRLRTDRAVVVRFGRVGYGARSVVWAVVGWLVVRAAMDYDPDQVGGVSTALQELADSTGGPWVLAAVALGLFSFGAFCIAEARYRTAA
jgi:hypothetical protein